MHSNEENSGSESENDFESLFEEKNPEESVFYFKNISVQCADCFREVTYTFNVDDSIDLSCSLTIAEDLSSIPLDIIERMLLAIGLCALPWYWMGFSTRRIVIEKSVRNVLSANLHYSFHTEHQPWHIHQSYCLYWKRTSYMNEMWQRIKLAAGAK